MKRTLLLVAILLSFATLSAQTKVIAHRGYWNTANSAHNSLTSLSKTNEIGAYAIEFDVWQTSDGVLVVHHDDKINGITIPSSPYEKIRDQHLSNGELLPTLDEFLVFAKNYPDLKLILEMKSSIKGQEYTEGFVDRVLTMVEKHKLAFRTDYIAFSFDICKELVRRRPRAKVAYLGGGMSLQEVKAAGLSGIDYHFSTFLNHLNLVNEAHALGLSVNVWTVDDPIVMRRLIGMGVDYITTDQPVLAQQVIREYIDNYTPIYYPEIDLATFKKDKKGYITLFDGTSLNGWRSYAYEDLSPKWTIDGDALKFDSKKEGRRGDIIFGHRFRNFELDVDWKISKAGNSGIFYLVQEIPGQYAAASAPEAQVLDNENHPDAKLGKDGNRTSSSLYDLIPATPQNAKPYGEWNHTRIRVLNGKVQHFQNGQLVVEYTLWTPEWIKMLENSKFSTKDWSDAYYLMSNCGGIDHEGYIGFQDHGDDVWFKNIKIKILD